MDTYAATPNTEAKAQKNARLLDGWEPADDVSRQRWIDPVTERNYSGLRAMDLVRRRTTNAGVQT